jgi:two-component system, sensor histidine kinase and response regulator
MLPILVVEDNAINRDVAVLQLQSLGFPVEAVCSAEEALELVKTKRYSLILMDVMMPDMDGWEACRRIRDHERSTGQYTPVIACSAWTAEDNHQRCTEAGMDDYVSKPYSREDLAAVVGRWLKADATKS